MKQVNREDCAVIQTALSTAIERELRVIEESSVIPNNSPEVKTSIREREHLVKDYDRLRVELSDTTYWYKQGIRNRK